MSVAFESSFDRRGWATGRWTGAALAIAVLHVAGAAGGYLYWERQPTELLLPPPTLIAFELAPVPVAPPTPQPPKVEEVPEIEPAPEPPPVSELELAPPAPPEVEVAVAVPEKPKPIKKKPKKKPDEKKKKTEKKKPVDNPPPPQPVQSAQTTPTPQQTTVAPPNLPPAPTPQGPKGENDPEGPAKQEWFKLLSEHINKHLKFPKAAKRKHQQGTVMVSFVFDRAGNVLSVNVERSSGFEILDEAAKATLHRADPLPPVPPEISGGDTLQFRQPLNFFLTD